MGGKSEFLSLIFKIFFVWFASPRYGKGVIYFIVMLIFFFSLKVKSKFLNISIDGEKRGGGGRGFVADKCLWG